MDDWFWEGNVVSKVVSYLEKNGWMIDKVADTEKREAGVDIQASRYGALLLVEAKGYPSSVYQRGEKKGQLKPTIPSTQARHWYSEILLTAILRQSDNPRAMVAIALPHITVYSNLVKRTGDVLKKLSLTVIFVRETGEIEIVNSRSSELRI